MRRPDHRMSLDTQAIAAMLIRHEHQQVWAFGPRLRMDDSAHGRGAKPDKRSPSHWKLPVYKV
jgi:hypothetical protein